MNRSRQKGVSLIGVLIIGGLLGFVLMLGMRSLPAYNEYMAVKKVIKQLANEPYPTVTAVQQNFDLKASVDDISSIRGTDLDISKNGSQNVITVNYERRIPIAGNAFLVFVFAVDSREL